MQYRKSNKRKSNKRNRKSRKGGAAPRNILLRFPIMNSTTSFRMTNIEESVPSVFMDSMEAMLRGVIETIPNVQIIKGGLRLNSVLDVYEIGLIATNTQEEIEDWIQQNPIIFQVFKYVDISKDPPVTHRYNLGPPTVI